MVDILNIAICEDTEEECEKLCAILAASPVPNRCTVFRSAEELLAVYRPLKFDLLLMDIYMDGITGVEAVSKIREMDREVLVAFITTCGDFALESYRLSALNYLLKPFRQEEIEALLLQAQTANRQSPSLTVLREGREVRITLSHIISFEIQNHHVLIYLTDGSTLRVYQKLSELMALVPMPPFFQSHKSFCVNLDAVQYINQELNCFVMSNGRNIPIRRSLAAAAKKAFQSRLLPAHLGGKS